MIIPSCGSATLAIMRTSVWSSYFLELSPEEMVDVFSKSGWSASELSDEHAVVLLKRGEAGKVGRQFRQYADDKGFCFPQGHLWLNCDIAALDQRKTIDDLKVWLDLFYEIGITAAVLHPGGREMIEAGYGQNRIMEARVIALRELSEHIKGSDMFICLENIPATCPECEDLLRIVEEAGCPNIGICLDTGHLNLKSGDQVGFIKKAGTYLKALHIADNEGKSDQHLMPYGRGTIDWDKVLAALKENGYSGLFNLEIPGESRCPMPIKLAKLDYIKRMVEYMAGRM